MYRLLIVIVLCLKAASSAPQTKESDVTYVKIQPVVDDAPVGAASNIRESRIEKLSLTIPGNVSKSNNKEPDKNLTENSENKSDISEIEADLSESNLNLSENLDLSESKQSDTLSSTDELNSDTTDDLSEIGPTDDLSQSGSDNLSDTVPSETNQSDRQARNFDSVETTETADDVTVKYEDELIDHTAIEAPRTKAPPKFVPKEPKLSYFKPRAFHNYSPANQLENAGKRRFRSRCSCQKIWNCPKLQITVPRCPDEYFLCCF